MAVEFLKVKYVFRYVDADPDGTPCDDCGERIFLSARALEGRYGRGKWEHHYTFCASCADCRENNLEMVDPEEG